MPEINLKYTIEKFYETIKDKYPNLSFKMIQSMCESVPKFIRSNIEDKSMPFIRIKYMGTWLVYEKRVIRKLAILEKMKARNTIHPEEYTERKKFLEDYLVNLRRFNEAIEKNAEDVHSVNMELVDDLPPELRKKTKSNATEEGTTPTMEGTSQDD